MLLLLPIMLAFLFFVVTDVCGVAVVVDGVYCDGVCVFTGVVIDNVVSVCLIGVVVDYVVLARGGVADVGDVVGIVGGGVCVGSVVIAITTNNINITINNNINNMSLLLLFVLVVLL